MWQLETMDVDLVAAAATGRGRGGCTVPGRGSQPHVEIPEHQ